MQYTWQALSSVWVIIFTVFVLIASSTVTGNAGWLLMLSGVVAPAIILAIDEKLRKVPAAATAAPFTWPNSGFRNIGRGTKGG